MFPGIWVIVHVPDEGSPFKTTLLLEIVPITGGFGNEGWLTTTFADATKVILTGSFNNWDETELLMQKTATGWQLSYVVAPGNYEYKFIVDGQWMPDPANPFTIGTGNYTNSLIALKANHVFELEGFNDAENVIVTGSFNGWSHDGYHMSRRDGKWVLPLNMNPGKYTYKFIVDEKWILDPANKLYEANEYDTDNSVLWVGE